MGVTQSEDCRLCTAKISPIGISKGEARLENKMSLNLGTNVFPENREGGLMICGLNWGGEPDPGTNYNADMIGESFFSDDRINNNPNYPKNKYNNRIVEWFGLLGHPLETSRDKAGAFEYSLIQTNWLRGQSRNVKYSEIHQKCIEEWDSFEFHVARFRPKLIVFLSVRMLDVLNSDACKKKACRLLGHKEEPFHLKRDEQAVVKGKKSFRIRIQRFRDADIIALPHPTGSRGLRNNYVAEFKDFLFPIICTYKATRGFKLSDKCK